MAIRIKNRFWRDAVGKRKLIKYLTSKPESAYSNLDKVLNLYAEGKVTQLLSKHEFYDIEFFFHIRKFGNDCEIIFKYYNLATNICFSEAGYFYVSYPMVKNTDKIAKTFDQRVVYCKYEDGFSLEELLETIFEKLKAHPELVLGPIPKNRRKLYAILSAFFILLPFIVVGGMALYGLINDVSVYGDWWMAILFLGSVFLGNHFYYKAQK